LLCTAVGVGNTVFVFTGGETDFYETAAAASRLVTRGSIFTGCFFSSFATTLDCAFSSRFLKVGAASCAAFLMIGFSTGTFDDCWSNPRSEEF